MARALMSKDWGDLVMEAHMKGYITRTQLKSLVNLLPEMKAAFNGTMESVKEMMETLRDATIAFQATIPTDGSMAEAAGNQLMVEMVKTGSALIRKVLGLVEGAF